MLMIVTIGGLAGFLLGLRFKIFALVPTILLGLAAAVVLGSGHGAGWIMLAMTAAILSIQLGYLAGAITGRLIVAARSRAPQPASTQAMGRVRSVISR